ncbi:hypothetical protein [Spiroplasma endosymbiont of Aspidapion aeneum]|uniref:hypothetical protein n=1 Tax=Spiroplasma endosymbiont of Aspidapion aeneum TaxID=3066276 RepID=UPI00313EF519
MKNSKFLIDFNNSVKKSLIDTTIDKKVLYFFNLIKETFEKIDIKKIGDFRYKTYERSLEIINLDIAFVFYKTQIPEPKKIFTIVSELASRVNKTHSVNISQNIIQIIFKSDKVKYIFNAIIMYVNSKDDKHYAIINNKWNEENVLKVCDDFLKANKISSGFLVNIKHLINFVLKDDFAYTYNIDYMILRGFYEYIAKTIKDSIANEWNSSFDIKNFLKTENLSFWLKHHINFQSLGFYILNNMYKKTTYFFSEFDDMIIELFESVSRYSLNSITGFVVPANYFSFIDIFNIKNNDELRKYQNNMKVESGYSISAFDYARQHDLSFVCTPYLKSGQANINLLRYEINRKSKVIFNSIPSNLRDDIITSRSRENLEYLNQLAYNFLSAYKSKIEYLKIYFDKKYPLIRNQGYSSIIDMIKKIVNSLKNTDWILENDF